MPKIKPINCSKSEFINSLINPARLHERAIKQRYPFHYEQIAKCMGLTFAEKLYNYAHDIIKPPICHHCGAPVSFINFNKGYCQYCSNKCATADPKRLKKMQQTCLKRYGVTNVGKSKTIREKAKATCLERFGCENPSSANEIKERRKKTNIERYGYENAFASDAGKEKLRQTCIEKYGEANNKQAEAKAKHSDIIRFEGRAWICRCPHPECDKCTEKWYETRSMLYKNRKESGAELCTRLLPLQPTYSTAELKMREFLNIQNIRYISNDRTIIKPREVDIYLPECNIAIEYNGSYHHSVEKHESWRNAQENKYLECTGKNIPLVQIWDSQYIAHYASIHNLIQNYTLPSIDIQEVDEKCIKSFIKIFDIKYIRSNFKRCIMTPQGLVGVVYGQINNDKMTAKLIVAGRFDKFVYDFLVKRFPEYRIKVITYNDFGRFIFNMPCIHVPPEPKSRTIKGHGTYTTYDSGTSIWTI